MRAVVLTLFVGCATTNTIAPTGVPYSPTRVVVSIEEESTAEPGATAVSAAARAAFTGAIVDDLTANGWTVVVMPRQALASPEALARAGSSRLVDGRLAFTAHAASGLLAGAPFFAVTGVYELRFALGGTVEARHNGQLPSPKSPVVSWDRSAEQSIAQHKAEFVGPVREALAASRGR